MALTSAEHPTLPIAELKALMETMKNPFKINEYSTGLAVIESNNPINHNLKKASMTKAVYKFISESGTHENEIKQKLILTDLPLQRGFKTFSVRVDKAPALKEEIDTVKMESFIGKILKDKLRWKVNLDNPQVRFQGFILKDRFLLGLNLFDRPKGIFKVREPSVRPRFHPATLTPKLAKCMVNLARVKPGGLLLDSFCGVGGILIEAGLMGCHVIGVDAQEKMCMGCLENLRHYHVNPTAVILGDALRLPIESVDHIVTDPPYGTAATTMKRSVKGLLTEFMPICTSTLKVKGYSCIAAPEKVHLADIGSDSGLSIVETHRIYVHKSLTREIVVFKKL